MENQLLNLPNGNFAIDNVFFDNGVGFLENLNEKFNLNKVGVQSFSELNATKWLNDEGATYSLDDILDGKLSPSQMDDVYVSFDFAGSPVGSPLSSSDESSCDFEELLMSAYPPEEVLASASPSLSAPEYVNATTDADVAEINNVVSPLSVSSSDDEMNSDDILQQLLNGGFDLPIDEDVNVDLLPAHTIDMASFGSLQLATAFEVSDDTADLKASSQDSLSGKVDRSKKSAVKENRATPYKKKPKTTEQKQRKKCQNRNAAVRYRNKKKEEMDSIFNEADELENKNKELRDKVGGLKKEVEYLKNLMLDVIKVRLAKNNNEADVNLSALLTNC